MIAFVTLLLGLYLGPQEVELAVADGVERVELRLDGALVARLTRPPWRATVELGDELLPRELTAVAFDASGRQLAAARQAVNMPRPLAEAEVVVSGAGDGREALATVTWNSIVGDEPRGVSVRFDGRPLAASDPRRIELPEFDPRKLHFLSVDLEFDDYVNATVETTFGGQFGGEINLDLTALPVTAAGKPPRREKLAGRFTAGGQPLEVLAVDKGPADLVLVRDLASHPAIVEMARIELRQRGGASRSSGALPSLPSHERVRGAASLKRDHTLRLLWPLAQAVSRRRDSWLLFPPSPELAAADGGLLYLLSDQRPPVDDGSGERLADAVAVAGMIAAGRNQRRAVVVLLAAPPRDTSQLAPRQAIRYLEALGVPLFVRSLDPELTAPGWPEPVDVSDLRRLEKATRELVDALDRQRIVWLDGLHLPTLVAIDPGDDGLRLAGREGR